jgi:hypothetical protein
METISSIMKTNFFLNEKEHCYVYFIKNTIEISS